MSWTALIPLNAPARRKSRLSGILSATQRTELSEAMYRHVLDCVELAGVLEAVFTLSPAGGAPNAWVQREPELNVELTRIRTLLSAPLLILNADLPWLQRDDVHAMIAAAERDGCALAPDRHGTGTNAVALAPEVAFEFAFGPGSLAAHLRAAPQACAVCRPGLAFDLDTPADLADLLASGHPASDAIERLLWPPAVTAKWAHVD